MITRSHRPRTKSVGEINSIQGSSSIVDRTGIGPSEFQHRDRVVMGIRALPGSNIQLQGTPDSLNVRSMWDESDIGHVHDEVDPSIQSTGQSGLNSRASSYMSLQDPDLLSIQNKIDEGV